MIVGVILFAVILAFALFLFMKAQTVQLDQLNEETLRELEQEEINEQAEQAERPYNILREDPLHGNIKYRDKDE